MTCFTLMMKHKKRSFVCLKHTYIPGIFKHCLHYFLLNGGMTHINPCQMEKREHDALPATKKTVSFFPTFSFGVFPNTRQKSTYNIMYSDKPSLLNGSHIRRVKRDLFFLRALFLLSRKKKLDSFPTKNGR